MDMHPIPHVHATIVTPRWFVRFGEDQVIDMNSVLEAHWRPDDRGNPTTTLTVTLACGEAMFLRDAEAKAVMAYLQKNAMESVELEGEPA